MKISIPFLLILLVSCNSQPDTSWKGMPQTTKDSPVMDGYGKIWTIKDWNHCQESIRAKENPPETLVVKFMDISVHKMKISNLPPGYHILIIDSVEGDTIYRKENIKIQIK